MILKLLIPVVLVFVCNISFGAKYFAEVTGNNVVSRVIVADSVEWCKQHLGGKWIETFMDNPDKNYAGKGHDYYETYKDFVSPTPFTSWVLNEKRKWIAPIAMPQDNKHYKWNENGLKWEAMP